MIIFKKIRWKNFLSTGNTPIEIDLNKSPTTLIIGTNGSGKSTLLDAICFVLFNRPFRIIKKEQIVNTINNGDCVVEIDFTVGQKTYQVRRGIKPNLFEIYCDGELLNQEANTIDYQRVLEQNIMKLNYRSFVQVIILGSSSYEPFMKMKARYRRDVVEEILDIKVFTQMDLILRDQQSLLSKNITEVRHRYDLLDKEIELQSNHLNTLETRQNHDKDYKLELLQKNEENAKKIRSQIEELESTIKNTETTVQDKEKAEKKLRQLEKIQTKIEQNLTTHKKALEFFQENDNCPTCTQKLEETFRGEKIAYEKGKLTTLNDGMKDLVQEITKAEEQITEYTGLSNKIRDMNIDLAKLNTSLDGIYDHTTRIQKELESLSEDDIEKIKTQLQEQKQNLSETLTELEKITEEKKYVDILREILSEKGARKRIIKKYLPIMNTLINQFLQSMDFFISFHLDEEFNETVKSRHRDTFDYNCFSEGEKMRIDLALVFTWRAIAKMKNSTNTNLLILDEIFDSSLDGQGTEDFFKIIQTLTNENVFIISHKGDILFDKFTNIIKFEKQNNFTRLQNV